MSVGVVVVKVGTVLGTAVGEVARERPAMSKQREMEIFDHIIIFFL